MKLIKELFGEYPSGWYTGRTSPNTRELVIRIILIFNMIVIHILMIFHIGKILEIKNI